jgi:type IV secretory pathway VirB3-like protein
MDMETLVAAAETVKRLKMYPYFEVAHYILMCMAVREDNFPPQSTGVQTFSRLHPLACWFGSMMLCFAGGILGNFLLGEPLLSPFQSEREVLIATLVWYLINYAPFDFVYKLCKFAPVRFVISMMKEVQRANRINHGVLFALKNFPGSHIVVGVFGVLKGSASQHMRVYQRLVCGLWQPTSLEILKPAPVTKACLVASVTLILLYEHYINLPVQLVYAAVILFLCIVRLFHLVFNIDIFTPFENLFCSIFMGGLMDALKRVTEKPEDPTAATTKNNPSNKPKEE